MKPEQMTIQMTDGSDFKFTVLCDKQGRVWVQTFLGSFVLRMESARSVCVRLTEMINEIDRELKVK